MLSRSAALNHKPVRPLRLLAPALLMFTLLLVSASAAVAQDADTRDLDAYLHAIKQPAGSLRAAALERFASAAPASSLKLDALEWIVWEEKQSHNQAAAATWARKLLTVDADNPLALAMVADEMPRGSSQGTDVDSANRGLAAMGRLRRPEGMSYADFTQLRQYVEARLSATVGYAEFERRHYPEARAALARAVAASPNDARLVYTLALADLEGDKPNRREGYWLMAKAVNLAGGPSVARQIEEFGRKKYKEDGGSDTDWDQYLASTASSGVSAAMVVGTTEAASVYGSETRATQSSAGRGTQSPPARATAGKASKPATNKTKTRDKRVAKANQPAAGSKSAPSRPGWKGEPEPPPESTAAANSLPPIPADAAVARRSGPPVSLGILIETSLTGKSARHAIVYSLSDLVRRLGAEDEAFILSFSDDLVFEEDLTGDAKRLERAMDTIKPHPGTALLDAVAFAAGHLRRISKNDSRVLLVISDGRNANSRIPATAASSEIRASGVKIYCIGMDVGGTESMYRLQALASGTGGSASFVTAPDQFRAAAQRVGGSIGIPFEF